jgi:hypothetical protein
MFENGRRSSIQVSVLAAGMSRCPTLTRMAGAPLRGTSASADRVRGRKLLK